MNKIDKLVEVYFNWGAKNNLALGSADEEIFVRTGL